jgi:hypothetical protein
MARRAQADAWSTRRGIRLAALLLVGFAATTAALHALVPWPDEYGLRAKLEWFEERRDDFDVVFVGSSRVFRGVDPRAVDEELARAGYAWRSANLGVGGMSAYEIDYVLRLVVDRAGPRLKWLVVEGRDWDPDSYFLGNTYSPRSVGWHDLEGTRRALRATWTSAKPTSSKWRSTWTHLELAGMKLLNVGEGRRIVQNLVGTSADPLHRSLAREELERARGFQALDDLAGDEARAWRTAMIEHPEKLRERIQNVRGWNKNGLDVRLYDVASTHAQRDAVRARGARLAVLLPPSSEGTPAMKRLAEYGEIEHLLDYNDPDRWPRFFELDARFDWQHLNAVAADEFSRLVGARLAELQSAEERR